MTDLAGAGLPLVEFDGPETGDLEMAPATANADAYARNYMWLRQRRVAEKERDLTGEMSKALYGDPEAWRTRFNATGTPTVGSMGGVQTPVAPAGLPPIDRMFEDMARMKATMPGEFANFPATRQEMTDWATGSAKVELTEEEQDAQERLANRTDRSLIGGVASFGGGMATAVTDIEGIATLPFGFSAGTFGRRVLWETALGGASEAITIPAYQAQAEFLGTDAPDPMLQVLSGMAFGAALPIAGRGIRLGVNTLTPGGRVTNRELLGMLPKDAAPLQRGAAGAVARDVTSEDIAANPDTLDAAERALQDDTPQMVRVEDVVAGPAADTTPAPALPAIAEDAPENWRTIRNGIFVGESGGDYEALFAYSNRQGGPFEGVKLTEMTVDQAVEFSAPSGPYGQWVKDRIGRVATPMGAYQIVGTTLRLAKDGLGLTGDELMTPDLQERLGQWIYRQQGTDAWEGYRGPRETFRPAKGGRYTGGGVRISTEDGANNIYGFDPNTLGVDAATYQFKAGGDEFGVTGRLTAERIWDPDAAIGIIVHERLNGSQWVVDGHQRTGHARRLMDQGHPPIELVGTLYRESDGYTVEMVRAAAAAKNIRQESGTPLDAARILRDDPSLLTGMNRSRPFMLQAQGLADLAPGPFQAVVNDVIPQNFGAIVGRIIPDDDRLQAVAIAALKKSDPANEAQAEAVIRDIRRLGLEQAADDAQMDLFGAGFDLRSTVITERSKIIDRVIKDARKDRALFTRLEQQADTITEAGNVLNRAENLDRAEIAERTLAKLQILAEQPGPVRDAIDAAARALRAGTRIEDAAGTVFDALGGADGAGARGRAADGVDGRGAADAGSGPDIPPPRLTDLPAIGDARLEPGLFDDPLTDPTDTARVDAALRDLDRRMQEEPTFDLFLPASAPDAAGNAATGASLRSLMTDLADEAAFITDVALTCIKKGT